jgi:uncharacterized membrane protein YphA (DoxX/SURF4 family)
MRLGVYVFGLGTIATGILDLVWGDFDAAYQPIQAFGDHIPGRVILAYLAGVWLIAGGAAILWRRTARPGAAAVAFIYLIFAAFWLPRFYTAPHYLGFHLTVLMGVLSGAAQQLILVAAGALLYARAAEPDSVWRQHAPLIARWTFGLSAFDFGLGHLTGVQAVATMVPKWIPLGGAFWTVLTGVGFVLAGIAILSRVLDVLAARLLALMLLVFSALALPPLILASPHDHVAWGSNAYNLAAVGAAWIFVESIARRRAEQGQSAQALPQG